MKNSCPNWIRFGKPLTTHLSPVEGLFALWATFVFPDERTKVSMWWFRFMLRSRNIAA